MQGSHAESYQRLIADRVAEIPVPERFRDPDVLIAGEGIEVSIAVPSTDRPRPVLTVGERLAVEAPRDVVKGVVAVHIARAHLGHPAPVGQWVPTLLIFSGVFVLFGLATGIAPFLFLGGIGIIGGVLGLRSRIEAAQVVRARVHQADELAADWVGRQAVVDGLRWVTDRAEPDARFGGRLAPPTVQDRLRALGA
ncbi:hypothetical protein FAF44_03255 [Nonomuraea sp. MG754425]|uniref:hypothetical protein n=1 Tax=Nonomuraea sp. MG754425 TaxID=2570319 RepID=UPI001F303748|nr:hypothetical protein [Nonomuraea sp. MG754425]MCF6467432.1 hypothetical protein [Nonomuraea sp. MG754425]